MNLRGEKSVSLKAIVIVVTVLAAGLIAVYMLTNQGRTGINKDGYQQVILSTGERYIGKLAALNGDYVALHEVYYQQSGPDSTEEETTQNEVVVAKLSSTVAKPEDTMHIARDKIVHWENLQQDSKIVQAIKNAGN